jgi:hypothetical protein
MCWLTTKSGLCPYIWETFPYVFSPTLAVAYYHAHFQYYDVLPTSLYYRNARLRDSN